jgi:NADH-quinone oxidoreductase subunit M
MVESVRFLAILCVVAIVAISLVCFAQKDVKRLVAYSSVSHMGVCMLGLLALNPAGVTGSVMYMINHGLSTGALFLCIGMMYERYHTKDMAAIGGLAKRMPIWAFFMVFFTMTSVGLPGLNGFVSEILCLFGAFTANPATVTGFPGVLGPKWVLIAGVGSVIFGAVYMLYMVGKVVWGPLKEPHDHGHDGPHAHQHGHAISDLNAREILALAPIAVVCLAIGVQPWPLLDAIEPSVRVAITGYPEAVREYVARPPLSEPIADAGTIAPAASDLAVLAP